MEANKLKVVNVPDKVRKTILDQVNKIDDKQNHIFHWGIVVGLDSKNANRIKVRVPIIDDLFFSGKNTEENIKKLPWCVPINKRIIETPEIGSTVLVGLFSLQDVHEIRIWFDVVDYVDENIPDDDVKRLDVNPINKSGWEEMEKVTQKKYNVAPGVRNQDQYPTSSKRAPKRVMYKGKSKNVLIFDEKETKLIQNKGENNESSFTLSENVDIESSDHIKILSRKSSKKEKPIFADPFIKLFQKQQEFNQTVLQVLSAGAGNTTVQGAPITPSPQVPTISQKLVSLSTEFEKFKQEGISKNIDIN